MRRSFIRPALAASLALAAPAAPAQEEDRDETRLPPVSWETRYVGRYAVDGECDDPAKFWVLAETAVDMGHTVCIGIGKRTWEGDRLMVPMSDCVERGEERPDRVLGFEVVGPDEILVTADGEEVILRQCS
ncbi:hypothetical protein [Tranquillimonas alkanivorans]|uniref:Uncharacterized protein n=1 Tax=Tranquillimonas alkanivorans TaxID=441119 RepID=A0A1I5MFJ5_9RHOB|nr:hypothetical protein [Tranquillimonas alkanivorans]SFP08408.1 hypothetical protein SAMN04488047_102252 [Tranquillimonas alkanivorans]